MKTCWQIRQALTTSEEGPAAAIWLLSCTDCTAAATGVSCWELEPGSPACCAPVDITCDFCALYIEHRMEIASLTHHPAPLEPQTTHSGHPKGGKPVTMETLQLNVPDLFADHHVLRARATLTALPGVQDVVASSAFRMVAVQYQPEVISADGSKEALAKAGYPVMNGGGAPAPGPALVPAGRPDPAWDRLGMRVSRTDARDARPSR